MSNVQIHNLQYILSESILISTEEEISSGGERGKSTDIPIIRSTAFEEQCASSAGSRVANGEVRTRADSGGRHKNYNFPFHCIEWPQPQTHSS